MREEKRPALLVPLDNADEAAVVEGLDVYPVSNLRQAADIIAGRLAVQPYRVDVAKVFETHLIYEEDFADVKGQSFDVTQDEAEHAKHAIEVAVAGGHNLLMTWPPEKVFIYTNRFHLLCIVFSTHSSVGGRWNCINARRVEMRKPRMPPRFQRRSP